MLGSLKEKLGFGKKGEVLYAPIEGEVIELAKSERPDFW